MKRSDENLNDNDKVREIPNTYSNTHKCTIYTDHWTMRQPWNKEEPEAAGRRNTARKITAHGHINLLKNLHQDTEIKENRRLYPGLEQRITVGFQPVRALAQKMIGSCAGESQHVVFIEFYPKKTWFRRNWPIAETKTKTWPLTSSTCLAHTGNNLVTNYEETSWDVSLRSIFFMSTAELVSLLQWNLVLVT